MEKYLNLSIFILNMVGEFEIYYSKEFWSDKDIKKLLEKVLYPSKDYKLEEIAETETKVKSLSSLLKSVGDNYLYLLTKAGLDNPEKFIEELQKVKKDNKEYSLLLELAKNYSENRFKNAQIENIPARIKEIKKEENLKERETYFSFLVYAIIRTKSSRKGLKSVLKEFQEVVLDCISQIPKEYKILFNAYFLGYKKWENIKKFFDNGTNKGKRIIGYLTRFQELEEKYQIKIQPLLENFVDFYTGDKYNKRKSGTERLQIA